MSGFGRAQRDLRIRERVLKGDKNLYQRACDYIDAHGRRNSLFYAEQDYPDAATMPLEQLNHLVWAPKPQDFLRSREVVDLIYKIYTYYGQKRLLTFLEDACKFGGKRSYKLGISFSTVMKVSSR